jgi:hypothetical protein
VNPSPTTLWRDPAADPDVRLDVLIAQMILAEKVAQLGSVWLGLDAVTGEVAPCKTSSAVTLPGQRQQLTVSDTSPASSEPAP